MAREREQAVVRLRVEPDRARAERRDEPLDELDARRVARRQRRQEPGRAVEEIGGGARRAAGRAARERMAGHEARRRRSPARAPRFVEPTSVTVASRRRRGEHVARRRDERADRHGDDDELRAGDRVRERRRGLVERLAPAASRSVAPSASQPVTRRDAGPLRREGDRGSEEARADDRERGRPPARRGPRCRRRRRVAPRGAPASSRRAPRRKSPARAAPTEALRLRHCSSRRSSASRSASISGVPVSCLCSLTRRTSSRRRFRASRTARSRAPISSRRRSRSSIRAVLATFSLASVLSVRLNPVAHTDIQEVFECQ